jgi:hypothetical protein
LEEAVLVSGITEEEEASTHTRWSGAATPTGHIDHVLFSPLHGLVHHITAIHDDSLWHGITDHRPKITAFSCPGGSPDGSPVLTTVYPKDIKISDLAEVEADRQALEWK